LIRSLNLCAKKQQVVRDALVAKRHLGTEIGASDINLLTGIDKFNERVTDNEHISMASDHARNKTRLKMYKSISVQSEFRTCPEYFNQAQCQCKFKAHDIAL